MLDLNRLRILRAVVASGSVNDTAHRLGLTPSTVSQHVHTLEREVGFLLVERVGRGIRPTPAAIELARASAEALHAMADLDVLARDLGRAQRSGSPCAPSPPPPTPGCRPWPARCGRSSPASPSSCRSTSPTARRRQGRPTSRCTPNCPTTNRGSTGLPALRAGHGRLPCRPAARPPARRGRHDGPQRVRRGRLGAVRLPRRDRHPAGSARLRRGRVHPRYVAAPRTTSPASPSWPPGSGSPSCRSSRWAGRGSRWPTSIPPIPARTAASSRSCATAHGPIRRRERTIELLTELGRTAGRGAPVRRPPAERRRDSSAESANARGRPVAAGYSGRRAGPEAAVHL